MDSLFSNNAETTFLSILLRNPEAYFDLKEFKSFMLSASPHKNLFDFLESLIVAGINFNYELLVNYLKASNKLGDCGGESYIKYLNEQNYSIEYLSEIELLVVNSYKARTLILLSTKIPEMVKNQNSVDSAINYLQENLNNLNTLEGGFKTDSLLNLSKTTWDSIVTKVNDPGKIEVTTGFKHLDIITGGYIPGDLWIIAGRPGTGKSAFMINSAVRGAKAGVSTAIFSKEMRKLDIMYRILAIETKIPIYNIRFGILNQKQLNLISETLKIVKDYPIHIDSNFGGNVDYMLVTSRKLKKLFDIKTIHLDYIQLATERNTESRHEIGRVSRGMKLLAEEIEITGIAYSQLNRDVEKRDDKHPILADLRESGSLEEDGDVVKFLYRDEMYRPDSKYKGMLEHMISKQRNGPIGSIMSKFDLETNIITETK